jgi:phosphoribosylformylglycinamidine synthase
MIPCEDSQILYIPFDTASFKLGGSLLAELKGHNGGPAPYIMDPDYFIDCYEVVRELVEDGVIMAGMTVGDGGLATAANMMCHDCGLDLEIGGLMSSYQEADRMKVLFGEIPGILLQVSDYEYDYLDSQLTLQDVAYYPVGRPTDEHKDIKITQSSKGGVANILAALLAQATEGED